MNRDEVFRKAEARRAKLLQQQELRMKKILLGSRTEEGLSTENQTANELGNLRTMDDPPMCVYKNGGTLNRDILPERRTEIKESPETELRHLKTDGAHFPRKVSLISSPADFKTVQQNQANKDGLFIIYFYSLIVSIHQLAYSLLPLLSLILLAVIGSVKQYNFLIPFGTSQLVRIVHVVHNNPNGLTFKLIDVLSALVAHLVIFSTFYIAISVFQQQRVI